MTTPSGIGKQDSLFHAHRGLKIAAGAVAKAVGPICPDQADEQEPRYLTARE